MERTGFDPFDAIGFYFKVDVRDVADVIFYEVILLLRPVQFVSRALAGPVFIFATRTAWMNHHFLSAPSAAIISRIRAATSAAVTGWPSDVSYSSLLKMRKEFAKSISKNFVSENHVEFLS